MSISVPDLLLAFLATAVTLAGFAGIVTSIDRDAAKVSSDLVSFRLRSLISSALSTILFAVLPLLAILLTGRVEEVWRAACAAQALWIAFYVVRIVVIRQSFRGERAQGMRLSHYYLMMSLGAAVSVMLTAAAFGRLPAAASYAVGVFWLVFSVALFFMRLVFTLDESLRKAE
ncbi:MAG: hypothetical protein HY243_08850 [Proteobacteria bacterium]|nr:hypothetical protein [Pseudomonadota bacterium]